MDTVYRVMHTTLRVVRSRAFSASALAVACAAVIAYVSLNMSAVNVEDGADNSRVVMTLYDNPYRAQGAEEQKTNALDVQAAAEPGQTGAIDVQVTADGTSAMFTMDGGTVADALAMAGVKVGKYDKLSYDAGAAVTGGMHIVVNRVKYREYTKTKAIPFETTIVYTNTLAKGKTQMRKAGVNGVKTLTYRECIENGKVVGTELVKEEVTKAPVSASKLIGVVAGTPVSPAPFKVELDESGQPVKYTKKFSGRATAYTSDRGDSGTRTAWAGRARVGVVAVNPKKIPYGSKLYIVSEDGSYVYGYAIAGDTGGGVRSGKTVVDLFYNTYEECVRFGVRNMNVYIIG